MLYMDLGPIVRRELLLASRRKGTYWNRGTAGITVLVVIFLHLAVCDYLGLDRSSLDGGRRFALQTFGQIVSAMVFLTAAYVVSEVAPMIAREREKKSIDALLASQLSSAQIVLGSLTAGLLRPVSMLATIFPIMAMLVPFWGVDPWLIALMYAGICSFTFAIASVAIFESVHGATMRRVALTTMRFLVFWLFLPIVGVTILPRIWPKVGGWFYPLANFLFDSTPMAVLFSLFPVLGRGPLTSVLAKMIVMQLVLGVSLTLISIVRLRPASRALYDLENRSLLKRLARRAPAYRRPPCGDDPVFWHEVHAVAMVNVFERILGQLVVLGGVLAFLLAAYWFAVPAYAELFRNGYGATPGQDGSLLMHPLVRLILNIRVTTYLVPGTARLELAMIARQFIALAHMLVVLIIAGAVSESLSVEKEKDTWLGLLATPLSGKEIIRAKMLGQIWKFRAMFGLILLVGLIGLTAGAFHPLGFVMAVVNFVISCWLMAAVGARTAIWAVDRKQAMNRTIIPAMFASMSGIILVFLPTAMVHVSMGIGCPGFLTWLSLITYGEFHLMSTKGTYPALAFLGNTAYPEAWWVLLTVLLGMILQAILAFVLTRSAYRVFDEAVGRPSRNANVQPVQVIEPSQVCELVA